MRINKTFVYKLLQGDIFIFFTSAMLEYVCMCADDLCEFPHCLMALNNRAVRML